MLNSALVKTNPNLLVFLPLFYTVWEDAVLTPSEVNTIEGLINSQEWLKKDEREFLLTQLNPASPPSAEDLINWREAIKQVAGTNGETNSLIELGFKLARLNNGDTISDALTKAKPALLSIEATLGLISKEAVYTFHAEGRKTLTSEQSTRQTFNISTLSGLLDGQNADIIKKVKAVISDPEFQYVDPGDLNLYREKVLQWCILLAKQGFGSIAYPKEYGGQADMAKYFAIMETLSYHDISMVIKFGVQFGLWGMSVYFLGTGKHHKKYMRDIGTLELPGCFAMTETNHGSNVKGIETTATYNHAAKAFVIHTPTESARKEYIGNAARHGQMATVFAKLILDGKDYV